VYRGRIVSCFLAHLRASSARIQVEDSAMSQPSSARSSRRKKVTLNHPIFTRWPAQYPDRLQLFSAPTPNGVKVGTMLEETSLAYEPHRIDILANESHDPAFLALNPNGKIPAVRTVAAQFPAAMKTIRTGYWKNSSSAAISNCDSCDQ
jgi:hypothetical protein